MARTDIPGVVDLVSGVKHRFDAWQNALTGLGTALRDKLQSTTFRAEANLSDEMVENLYHQEDMAARIVEALPEGALRRGYSLVVEGEEASDIPSDLFEYEKRLGFRKALKDAAIWGRCFGGAAIYLGIDDGQLSEEEPVNEDAIRSLDFALVLTKRELTPNSYYETADEGKLGMPETYRLSTIDGRQADGSDVIHETRLLRFDGARTSTRRRRRNNGWSDSVLQKVHGVLVQFNVGWASTSHILQDGSQGVFKIRGLIDMIADGDKETLNSRMELVDMGRSVARAIMVDAEGEDFQRASHNFGGLPEVLRAFMLRLSAASRMPVTILMGQAPAGLNATGESDFRMWYDEIEEYQGEEVLPHVERLSHLVFLARDFKHAPPERWSVKFHALWQLNDVEQAELEKKVAEKDKIYIDSAVLLPEEVALNRFKSGGFSAETQIDADARKEMLDAEIEIAKRHAKEDPLDAPDNPANADPAPADPGVEA